MIKIWLLLYPEAVHFSLPPHTHFATVAANTGRKRRENKKKEASYYYFY